jgi:hypothetical protein
MSLQIQSKRPIRILLQTTIPATPNDWDIGRFSLLAEHLTLLKDQSGRPLCDVTARNREADASGDEPILSGLDRSDFDELWLFAVDTGNGLSSNDCAGISRFRRRGGGVLSARDHQDLGSSLCTLGGVGSAHFFHSRNPDPDPSHQVPDDTEPKDISWPNYHSGSNGDYQIIRATEPIHELLRRPGGSAIQYFPAHPHEGAVGVPLGEKNARVIATGISQTTQRPFNLIVAFERAWAEDGVPLGRSIAEASFHHFVDYNWDIDRGAPNFVSEKPGDSVKRDPSRLEDIKAYVRNLALWLAPEKMSDE